MSVEARLSQPSNLPDIFHLPGIIDFTQLGLSLAK